MPVDTSLYERAQAPNPLAQAGQMVGMANAIQQNQILQRTMAARQAVGEAVQGATDDQGNFDPGKFMGAVSANPNAAYGAAEAQKFAQDQQTSQQALMVSKLQSAYTQQQALNQGIASVLSDPTKINSDHVTSQVGQMVAAGVLTPKVAASALADMPTDPQQLKSWLTQHLAQGLDASRQVEALIGKPQAYDTGGQLTFARTPEMGATPEPLAKTLSPSEATAPVQVFQGDHPAAITRQQFVEQAAKGPVQTGAKLGQEVAANVTAGGAAKQGADLSQQANEAKDVKALLGTLSADLKQFQSGPGAENWKHFLAGVQRLGIPVDSNAIANQESFNKVATMLAQRQFQQLGGTGTDQQLGSAIASNPNSALSNMGNQRIIAMLKGNADAIAVKNEMWQRWQRAGHSGETYNQFTSAFNKQYDPRVFQFQYLTPAERRQAMTGMNDNEKAQFRKSYQSAVDNGWIK